jgi:hypothetical protein
MVEEQMMGDKMEPLLSHIYNPNTERLIKVNGPTYNKLLKNGSITEVGSTLSDLTVPYLYRYGEEQDIELSEGLTKKQLLALLKELFPEEFPKELSPREEEIIEQEPPISKGPLEEQILLRRSPRRIHPDKAPEDVYLLVSNTRNQLLYFISLDKVQKLFTSFPQNATYYCRVLAVNSEVKDSASLNRSPIRQAFDARRGPSASTFDPTVYDRYDVVLRPATNTHIQIIYEKAGPTSVTYGQLNVYLIDLASKKPLVV